MKKVYLYILLFSKNRLGQLDSNFKKLLGPLMILLKITVLPIILGILLYRFFGAHPGFVLLIPFAVLSYDIDKAVERVRFSKDIKQMHQLKFTGTEFVIAKDLSKFYSSLLGFLVFLIICFILNLSNTYSLHLILSFIFSVILLFFGYFLRVFVLKFFSLIYNIYAASFMNYILAGVVALALYMNHQYSIFGTIYKDHTLLLASVAMIIYLIFYMILSILLGNTDFFTVKPFYDLKGVRNVFLFKEKKQSVISRSKLQYELILLFRNPPASMGLFFFFIGLSFGLLGLFIYVLETNFHFTESNPLLLYVLLIWTSIIASQTIQIYVSFDLDGELMQRKKTNDVFIINKIKVKEKLSCIAYFIIFIISVIVLYLFLPELFGFRAVILGLLTYINIALSTVTSTILFPYFKWEYFTEILSTLSKIVMNVSIPILMGLGIIGTFRHIAFFILAIILQIGATGFLLAINRHLWRKTIHKNYFSFRLLRE